MENKEQCDVLSLTRRPDPMCFGFQDLDGGGDRGLDGFDSNVWHGVSLLYRVLLFPHTTIVAHYLGTTSRYFFTL